MESISKLAMKILLSNNVGTANYGIFYFIFMRFLFLIVLVRHLSLGTDVLGG